MNKPTKKNIGPYRVEQEIGRGGMGVVFLARDSRLDRKVAIKALPEHLAQDPERLARFQSEARVLAQLSHPNVAGIHGLEEEDGQRFLILEYVAGESLAVRLERGPLEFEVALDICAKIASGVEAAHDAGIVHRDLKPDNVRITPDGGVKVLDFGLARSNRGASSSTSVTQDTESADVTASMQHSLTAPGAILGTAAYMSPEQARGQPVDKRTDIWSLGCLLFEMLTASRPFGGETVSDTLAAVLTQEPNWNALPADLHWRVRELLQRCLAKRVQDRLRDIGDARWQLARSRDEEPSGAATPQTVARLRLRPLVLSAAVAAIAGIVLGWWVFGGGSVGQSGHVARLSIPLPDESSLALDHWPNSSLAISPDGTWIAYRGRHGGGRVLHLRRIDNQDIKPVPGADGIQPFFSPDGEWVAFFGSGSLKKMNLAGGQPTTLVRDIVGSGWSFGSWGDDGVIVFSKWGEPLYTVSDDGGTPTALTHPAEKEVHNYPVVLPGSQHVLYVATLASHEVIRLLDRKTGAEASLLENAGHPHYLASGHLLFARDGLPMVVPFDPDRLELAGPAVPVPLDTRVDVVRWGNPRPQLAVSENGTLIFTPESPDFMRASTFVWVDREGNVEEVARVPLRSPYIDLSPDGKRALVTDMQAGESLVQILDLERANLSTLSRNRQLHLYGVTWKAADSVVYARAEDGAIRVMETVLGEDTSTEHLVDREASFLVPSSVSPDGKSLALMRYNSVSAGDIWILDLEGDGAGTMRPFSTEPGHEYTPMISLDGLWIAYVSESDLYASRFPQGTDRTLVAQRACCPRWSRDGRELFYTEAAPLGLRMISIPVATGQRLELGEPQVLFEGNYRRSSDEGYAYAVSPDGSRFLMMRYEEDENTARELTAVLNWFEELKRLAPKE